MTYTREQFLAAVRETGREGQPFTLAAVRAHLGLETRDKRELNRFSARFRVVQRQLGDELEKLGNGSYRLRLSELPDPEPSEVLDAVQAATTLLAEAASKDNVADFPATVIAAAADESRAAEIVAAVATEPDSVPLLVPAPTRRVPPPLPITRAIAAERTIRAATALIVAPAASEAAASRGPNRHWLSRRFLPLVDRVRPRLRMSASSTRQLLLRLRANSDAFRLRCSMQFGLLRARVSGLLRRAAEVQPNAE